jgi:hypothetical protein
VKVELLSIPNCPHVDSARQSLRSCLAELGIDAEFEERQGAFPSPTILVDEVDVMGAPDISGPTCRLDVPTRERIIAALRRAKVS